MTSTTKASCIHVAGQNNRQRRLRYYILELKRVHIMNKAEYDFSLQLYKNKTIEI